MTARNSYSLYSAISDGIRVDPCTTEGCTECAGAQAAFVPCTPETHAYLIELEGIANSTHATEGPPLALEMHIYDRIRMLADPHHPYVAVGQLTSDIATLDRLTWVTAQASIDGLSSHSIQGNQVVGFADTVRDIHERSDVISGCTFASCWHHHTCGRNPLARDVPGPLTFEEKKLFVAKRSSPMLATFLRMIFQEQRRFESVSGKWASMELVCVPDYTRSGHESFNDYAEELGLIVAPAWTSRKSDVAKAGRSTAPAMPRMMNCAMSLFRRFLTGGIPPEEFREEYLGKDYLCCCRGHTYCTCAINQLFINNWDALMVVLTNVTEDYSDVDPQWRVYYWFCLFLMTATLGRGYECPMKLRTDTNEAPARYHDDLFETYLHRHELAIW